MIAAANWSLCDRMRVIGMNQASLATGISASNARMTEWVRELRDRISKLSDAYRPELHYMRGPGPKWHAKHGQRPAPDSVDLTISGKAGV